jgi:hypothetical protein
LYWNLCYFPLCHTYCFQFVCPHYYSGDDFTRLLACLSNWRNSIDCCGIFKESSLCFVWNIFCQCSFSCC